MARVRREGVDAASILPLIPVIALVLFILGGLVVDGSRDLNARGLAQAYAEEAARAGASAWVLHGTRIELDDALAATRVRNYCAAVENMARSVTVIRCGLAGSSDAEHFTEVTTCGNLRSPIVVNTQVTLQIKTTLLGIVLIHTLDAGGQAKARPLTGIDQANAC